ncbi:phage holin family protein [Paenibacillus sp. An7]|uniref:phage holin family protein n=1 Tax=Paenibacillus sp. An7 TaxID=2689577 RepID=UPI00135827E5|nr:phage holin family protein [Paenibacillus sp. An7]
MTVGFTLKRTPKVTSRTIVYRVTLFAVVRTVWMPGWSPESLTQGVSIGAFAAYMVIHL